MINGAGFPEIESDIGSIISRQARKRKPILVTHEKYVDDMTLAEAFDLKKVLKPIPEDEIIHPVSYHERTKQFLPPECSRIITKMSNLEKYTNEHQMEINTKKTKSLDFLP